jgi:hypothetical protein
MAVSSFGRFSVGFLLFFSLSLFFGRFSPIISIPSPYYCTAVSTVFDRFPAGFLLRFYCGSVIVL